MNIKQVLNECEILNEYEYYLEPAYPPCRCHCHPLFHDSVVVSPSLTI